MNFGYFFLIKYLICTIELCYLIVYHIFKYRSKIMKGLITTFFLFILIGGFCLNSEAGTMLDKIEMSIIGTTYNGQKPETRLARIEEIVYGKKMNGKNNDRLSKLAKDLNADLIGQEQIIASSDEFVFDELEQPDNSVDYPVITDIEKNLKIKSNPYQSLHSRLVCIEKQLFNNVYDTDDFYTRVERIKGKVYKNSDVFDKNYDDILVDNVNSDIDDDWNLDKILNRKSKGNIQSKLSRFEKKIFDMTYSNQNTNDRLARLEREIFDTEFYDDSENERINRLDGAIKGIKTSGKYDNNKFQQRLNTALQVGAMILMVLACIL